jgi:hypothetical protein
MDKIAAVLNSQIDAQIDMVRDSITTGKAKDFAEYSYLCGVVRGLGTAKDFINVLNKKVENED